MLKVEQVGDLFSHPMSAGRSLISSLPTPLAHAKDSAIAVSEVLRQRRLIPASLSGSFIQELSVSHWGKPSERRRMHNPA